MEITYVTIKAVAELFSEEELRHNLADAVTQMLENPDQIVSASTGAGASYTKQLNMNAQELVELLSLCIEYKTSGTISGGNNIMNTRTLI